MKTKEPKSEPVQYFRLEKTDRNLFTVDVITVQDGKVIKQDKEEPAYLPIAFDKLRKRTANAYFEAIK